MKNPALRKEKRYEPAPVIPLKQDGSLLDWLEENNRIMYREEKETKIAAIEMLEDEDISDLIDDDSEDFDSSASEDSDSEII